MRKIGMVLGLLVCAVMAQAGEYAYLVFTNTSGSTTALTVSNLSAKINGSTLVVTNDDGTVNFTLTDLAAMQFSVDGKLSAIDNVLDADQPVRVFSISGTSLGTFDNLVHAVQQLGAGSYVVSNGKNAQTIVVQ